jgi:hypothetical protein
MRNMALRQQKLRDGGRSTESGNNNKRSYLERAGPEE